MQSLLLQLHTLKIINALDYQLAKYLGFDDLSKLSIALLSYANSLGHSLMTRNNLQQSKQWFNQNPDKEPYKSIYQELINKIGLDQADFETRVSQMLLKIQTDQSENYPLIYDSNYQALYFANNYQYELNICNFILKNSTPLSLLNPEKTAQLLKQLFIKDSSDEQKIAAQRSLTQKITLISGGPGTGKTTTVAKILAALIHDNSSANIPLRIGLCAPTGKAAARLTQSIQHVCQNDFPSLQLEPDTLNYILENMPDEAMTIHRLLKIMPQKTYKKAAKLNLDVLLIDEASMLDLAMMNQVICALPEHTRLILLGDKDQLASVEAGSVLAQLCQNINADYLVLLSKSYRFSADSDIGKLAAAVNNTHKLNHKDQISAAYAAFEHADNIKFTQIMPSLNIEHAIFKIYQTYFEALDKRTNTVQELFNIFNQVRVLSATRQDRFGVEYLNECIFQTLQRKQKKSNWFHGRPIMITQNSYSLNIFNGDVGLCLEIDGEIRIYFEDSAGIRSISPMRLPAHESAWVMTVHKSQGSEFNQVMLIMPPEPNYIITRELLYTAITRAKINLQIISSRLTFEHALRTKTQRASFIGQRIMDKIH